MCPVEAAGRAAEAGEPTPWDMLCSGVGPFIECSTRTKGRFVQVTWWDRPSEGDPRGVAAGRWTRGEAEQAAADAEDRSADGSDRRNRSGEVVLISAAACFAPQSKAPLFRKTRQNPLNATNAGDTPKVGDAYVRTDTGLR